MKAVLFSITILYFVLLTAEVDNGRPAVILTITHYKNCGPARVTRPKSIFVNKTVKIYAWLLHRKKIRLRIVSNTLMGDADSIDRLVVDTGLSMSAAKS